MNKAGGLAYVAHLYRHTQGKLGAGVMDMPAPLVDALTLYAQGVEYDKATATGTGDDDG